MNEIAAVMAKLRESHTIDGPPQTAEEFAERYGAILEGVAAETAGQEPRSAPAGPAPVPPPQRYVQPTPAPAQNVLNLQTGEVVVNGIKAKLNDEEKVFVLKRVQAALVRAATEAANALNP